MTWRPASRIGLGGGPVGEPGIAALAVVSHTTGRPDGVVIGTVSVAGPMQRLTPARYPEIAVRLHRAGSSLAHIWPLRQHQTAGQTAPAKTAGT